MKQSITPKVYMFELADLIQNNYLVVIYNLCEFHESLS